MVGAGKGGSGVLTPHADVGPEAEFRAMAPDGVQIHAARAPLGAHAPGGNLDQTIANEPLHAFAEPPLVDDATELLAAAPFTPLSSASPALVLPLKR